MESGSQAATDLGHTLSGVSCRARRGEPRAPHLHGEAPLVLPPVQQAGGRLPRVVPAVCRGEGAGLWLGVSAKRPKLQV